MLAANIDAVAVDEAYLARAGDAASDFYRYGLYPHNVHFVLTSAQMAGDGPTVIEAADRLDEVLPMDMAAIEGWIPLIKAAPWFARVQFGDAEVLEGVLAAPAPEAAPAYVEAAWRYARARRGAARPCRRRRAPRPRRWPGSTPRPTGTRRSRGCRAPCSSTSCRRRCSRGRPWPRAIARWRSATGAPRPRCRRELPYLEPPFWYYPTRQSFAAALLQDGQAARAEQEFFATLVESPDNGWAYWGLAKAREARGDAAGAEAAMTMWRDAWAGPEEPTLDRL